MCDSRAIRSGYKEIECMIPCQELEDGCAAGDQDLKAVPGTLWNIIKRS